MLLSLTILAAFLREIAYCICVGNGFGCGFKAVSSP